MEKKHIITIGGRPGSGKSSTAKAINTELGYQHFSSGDMFRALGREKGIDVLQANLSAEQNSELDHLVDNRLQEIGKTEDRVVIDSRTAWHWIPESFKIFLDLDLEVAAARILAEKDEARSATEQLHTDVSAYAAKLQERLDSETRRYKALYDIDPYDMSNYDLVVDTAENNLEQVTELVMENYRRWLETADMHV